MSQRTKEKEDTSTIEKENRSSTVQALRNSSGVCFSVKGGAYCSTFCDSTAVLVCSRAEGLPVSQALSQLAFRGQK